MAWERFRCHLCAYTEDKNGEENMRNFLYCNDALVNSIIAQKEKGLLIEEAFETSGNKGKIERKKREISAEATLSFFELSKAGIGLGIENYREREEVESTAYKKLTKQILHDAAFDKAYEYLKPILNDSYKDSYEHYFEQDLFFDFIDFGYYEKISKLNEDSEGLMTVETLKQVLPYKYVLFAKEGIVIPLDEKYFRVDKEELGFLYGGQMKCVGYISNIIGETCEPDEDNIFAKLQFEANELLRKILPTNETDLYVVQALAVFYDVYEGEEPENNDNDISTKKCFLKRWLSRGGRKK